MWDDIYKNIVYNCYLMNSKLLTNDWHFLDIFKKYLFVTIVIKHIKPGNLAPTFIPWEP